MKEYIERAATLDAARRAFSNQKCDCEVMPDVFRALQKVPAADVAEVRHGRWIVHFDHFAPYQKCSACGFEIPLVATENEAEICLYKHCPECTARMDKEDEQ